MRSTLGGSIFLLSRSCELNAREVESHSRAAKGLARKPFIDKKTHDDVRDIEVLLAHRLRFFQGSVERAFDGKRDGQLTHRNRVGSTTRTREDALAKCRALDAHAIEQGLESRARALQARDQEMLGRDAVEAERPGDVHRSVQDARRLGHGADCISRPDVPAPSWKAAS